MRVGFHIRPSCAALAQIDKHKNEKSVPARLQQVAQIMQQVGHELAVKSGGAQADIRAMRRLSIGETRKMGLTDTRAWPARRNFPRIGEEASRGKRVNKMGRPTAARI
jgi:hypothetical protein